MVAFSPRVAAAGLAARLQYFEVEGPDLEVLNHLSLRQAQLLVLDGYDALPRRID